MGRPAVDGRLLPLRGPGRVRTPIVGANSGRPVQTKPLPPRAPEGIGSMALTAGTGVAADVTLEDVLAARQRIRSYLPATRVGPLTGGDTHAYLVKSEYELPTGSFKVRGALNAALVLQERTTLRGLVTTSSGNHGIALAYAGALLGIAVTIVVPRHAPMVKVAAIGGHGAECIRVDPDELDATADAIAHDRGYTVLACDSPDIIAGQGTVGLELASQCPHASAVFVPVGTGSLLAGIAVALRGLGLATPLIGVEPVTAADARESLRCGRLVRWPVERTYRTVADGLRVPALGPTAFPIVARFTDRMVTVDELEIVATTVRLHRDCGIPAEPSGAAPVAAMRRFATGTGAAPALAVVTGGNVDRAWLDRVWASADGSPVRGG